MKQHERPARRYIAAIVIVVSEILFVGSVEAHAQQAVSFEQLQVLVKSGDTVSVTDSTGQTRKGKITELSRSSLRLDVGGIVRDMAEKDVSEIRQRRADSLGNGARNGAIAGAAFGTLGALLSDCRNTSCSGDRAAIIGVMTAFGAGIGVGVDALIIRTRVVYRSPGGRAATHYNITPLVGNQRKGIALSVRF